MANEIFKRVQKDEYESENFQISKVDEKEYWLTKRGSFKHFSFSRLKDAKEYANKHADNPMWNN